MRYLKAHWTRISVPHATQMLRFKFASLLCPFHDFLTHSLQVWFRDMAFRSGVYNCQSTEGSADKFKALFPHIHIFLKLTLRGQDSPIFQLQVTFAALQGITQSVFNPTKLVESLELRTTEQQDAQEFASLSCVAKHV